MKRAFQLATLTALALCLTGSALAFDTNNARPLGRFEPASSLPSSSSVRGTASVSTQADPQLLAKADLRAQESMAESTRLIASLTLAQIVIAVVTTMGLGASIALTWFSLRQTRQIIFDNRHYSEMGLRAYLGTLERKVHDYILGETVTITLVIRNFGSTPAKNVRVWSARTLVDGFPDNGIEEFPTIQHFRKIPEIAPGSTRETRFVVTPKLSQTMINNHTAATKSVALFIVVAYEDIFGGKEVFRHSEVRSGKALYRSRGNPCFFDQHNGEIAELIRADEREGA